MAQILIKRGLAANLPLEATLGELLYTTDTKRFYIGNGTGNPLTEYINAVEIATAITTAITAAIGDFVTEAELQAAINALADQLAALTLIVDTKASTIALNQAIADLTALINGKADVVHTHDTTDINGLETLINTLIAAAIGGVVIPTTFLALTDTPDTYVGQAGKIAIVNPTENGLIFTDTIDGGTF
jgi:hypothetical protein